LITSRRLTCTKDQAWAHADSLCVEAGYRGSGAELLTQIHNLYCPRLAINHAELEKAIAQDTDKFFSAASKSQALIAIQAICRRFGGLSAACKMMTEGLAQGGN
jgi:hypothetical protein